MQTVRADTIGGVNKFIEDQQRVAGDATFSLHLFDHEYEAGLAKPIKEVKPLTQDAYIPRGNTCLYGAIGCSIQATGERLKALSEDQRPEKVIFVIVTDGEENSSHKHEWSQRHTASSIKADIERQANAYGWQFVYIGANQDAITNAQQLGVNPVNALNYKATSDGTNKLYAAMSENVRDMRTNRKVSMSWSATQQKAQAEAK